MGDIKINVSSKGSWYKGYRTHLATYIKERFTPLSSDGNGNAYFFFVKATSTLTEPWTEPSP